MDAEPIAALDAKIDKLGAIVNDLIDDADKKNDYLFALRDAIAALGQELTGKSMRIVLLDRKGGPARWEVNPHSVRLAPDEGTVLSSQRSFASTRHVRPISRLS